MFTRSESPNKLKEFIEQIQLLEKRIERLEKIIEAYFKDNKITPTPYNTPDDSGFLSPEQR